MITPLEIREKRFKTGWPGFSKKEVIDFLDLLSIEFQELLKENRQIQQQLEEERGKKEKLIEREEMIKDVLMIAQSSSEKVLENANREAELMIREAELKAEKILEEANQKKNQILEQIQDLKNIYKQFKAKVQSTLEMYGRLLIEEDEEFGEKKGEAALTPKSY